MKIGDLGFDFGGKKRVFDMGFGKLGRKIEGFEERVMGVGRKVAISDAKTIVWLGLLGEERAIQ